MTQTCEASTVGFETVDSARTRVVRAAEKAVRFSTTELTASAYVSDALRDSAITAGMAVLDMLFKKEKQSATGEVAAWLDIWERSYLNALQQTAERLEAAAQERS